MAQAIEIVLTEELKSAAGTQSFIERTEEFNPPPPKMP
jgi:hypothetical protein